jgi:Na+-transporting NADH:ubiquinone oxidoreductase subunit B
MAATGIVFGVVFGKMVFGGFGKNIFNPALVGRAFLYINFANPMTGRWIDPIPGYVSGFGRYAADAVSGATPMHAMKGGSDVPFLNLLLGNTSGCMGETCAVLLIAGGLYLLWTGTANPSIVVSCIASAALLQGIFHWSGLTGAIDPVRALLSGGMMLGAFFMATDPVSACNTGPGRWIYGALIGILTIVIRQFSVWAEGFMFAVLLANMFGPIIDYAVKEFGWNGKKRTVPT